MIQDNQSAVADILDLDSPSFQEREEMMALGILSAEGEFQTAAADLLWSEHLPVARRAMHAAGVLNEAHEYHPHPSSFSRGLRVDLGAFSLLFISGTASVDEQGRTIHAGDFRAQCWRTYRNISALLRSEGATWKDVVRCTCYLPDMERDYTEFNRVRTAFFSWLGLEPLPASVGVQAKLCREDLLVEIEGLAIIPNREAATDR